MKVLMLLATAMISFGAGAAELNPKVDAAGRASVGMTYVYDEHKSWSLTLASDVSVDEMSRLPENLYWAIADVKSGARYSDWRLMKREDLRTGHYSIDNFTSLRMFLPKMKESALVISTNRADSAFSINLGRLCDAYPMSVSDLTNSGNPKCVVMSWQIPFNADECAELSNMMADLLAKKLVSCAVANKQMAKKGCDLISCR